jgi:uncharacterized protein (TIGR04255 family)
LIKRAALRFINHIGTSGEQAEIEHYLKLYPAVPQFKNEGIVGMFAQIQMPQPDIAPECMAVVGVGLAPEKDVTFVLDIDISLSARIDPSGNDVWNWLEKLRDRKNEIFEACITDKARADFQ